MTSELEELKKLLREGINEMKTSAINISGIMRENEKLKQEIKRLKALAGE